MIGATSFAYVTSLGAWPAAAATNVGSSNAASQAVARRRAAGPFTTVSTMARPPADQESLHGVTMTFTNPFVQQHWAWPALATPDASFTRTRRTYSPGVENVTVVVALPSLRPTSGVGFPNATAPGPWCLNHWSVTGFEAFRSPATFEELFPSWSAQT